MKLYLCSISQDVVDPDGIKYTKDMVKKDIDFLEKIDKKVFSKPNMHYVCIHGDTNPTNLLFNGFSAEESVDYDKVSKKGQCKLIDYELAVDAPYVYELASFFYVISSFPRNISHFQYG